MIIHPQWRLGWDLFLSRFMIILCKYMIVAFMYKYAREI